MGLGSWLKEQYARRETDAAREGKMGIEVKGIIGVLDNWKRIIMLGLLLTNGILALATQHDHLQLLNTVFGILGWNPSDAILDTATIATLSAGGLALMDGVVKEVRRIRAKSGTVALPR